MLGSGLGRRVGDQGECTEEVRVGGEFRREGMWGRKKGTIGRECRVSREWWETEVRSRFAGD